MRCYAKINLVKFCKNIEKILEKVSSDKVIGVIKANAYGHGAKEIYLKLKEYGINNFAVATVDEAIELNELDKESNILILGEVELENYKKIENTNIIISVSDEYELEYLLNNNLKNRVHIKLDTGMNRLGFAIEDLYKIDKYLDKVNIEGIFTHLSSADSDEEYTNMQIENFKKATDKYSLKKHILNSAGLDNYYNKKDIVLDYVRVGITMYDDVMSLCSRVCHIKEIKKDEYIGYDRTYLAKKGSYIATVSIGYADGLKRILSNKMSVVINGKKYRQVGNICMDLIMIEVDENVSLGDEVIIIGEKINIKDMAKLANTIDYEIMTSISNRVKRIYEMEEK